MRSKSYHIEYRMEFSLVWSGKVAVLSHCLVRLYFKSTNQAEDICSVKKNCFCDMCMKSYCCNNKKLWTWQNPCEDTHTETAAVSFKNVKMALKKQKTTQELYLLQACPLHPHLHQQTLRKCSAYMALHLQGTATNPVRRDQSASLSARSLWLEGRCHDRRTSTVIGNSITLKEKVIHERVALVGSLPQRFRGSRHAKQFYKSSTHSLPLFPF